MDLNNLGLFRMISRRMDWLTQRHEVLAENIANSDTPGYQARDIAPFDAYLDRAGARLAPRATDPAHITVSAGGSGPVARSTDVDDPYEVKPSGNNVSIEQQLMEVTENAMNHQLAINLYKKHAGMVRTALGRFGR